jgi:hypothetical protein
MQRLNRHDSLNQIMVQNSRFNSNGAQLSEFGLLGVSEATGDIPRRETDQIHIEIPKHSIIAIGAFKKF